MSARRLKFIPMKQYSPDPKFKAYITDVVEKLKILLGLNNYRININFVDKVKAYMHLHAPAGYTAEMEGDPVYMEIDLSISKLMEEKFNEGRLQYINEDLCHELVHELMSPYYDFAVERIRNNEKEALTNIDENTVQKITMIVMKNFKP